MNNKSTKKRPFEKPWKIEIPGDDIAPEEEIVAGKIAFTNERSFYSKYGDIFSYVILALYVALIGYNLYLKRRSPHFFCKKCRTRIEKGTKVCPVCGKKQK